jgi:crotonobetainyl-CoA:carnitine CoA-transferase CaiB-like acyl-CoA transferase
MKTIHLAAQGDPDNFEGPRVGGAYDPPERGWATADQPITFAFGGAVGEQGRAGWTDFVRDIGLEHMLEDPRYDRNGRLTTGLGPLARTLKPEYEAAFVRHPAARVVAKVRRHGGFATAYLDHAELMREAQVQEAGIVQAPAGGGGRPDRALAYPARFSALEVPVRGTAPALGEHTAAVLAGHSKETA